MGYDPHVSSHVSETGPLARHQLWTLAFLAGVVDAGWDRRPGTRRTRSHGRADHPCRGDGIALERRGFAFRLRDPDDSRKTLVYLTAKGRTLFSRVLPEMQYVNRMAVRGVSHVEQIEIKRLLKHMRANMARREQTFDGPARNKRRQ